MAATQKTLDNSLMGYFGFCEPAHRGAICRRVMGIGMLCNAAFADGGIKIFGKTSFSLSSGNLSASGLLSTGALLRLIRMHMER